MFTTPLATDQDALERVGGKGRSLSKMVREGFNVPSGFIVTADAYRSFIKDNQLQTEIVESARPELKAGYPVFDQSSKVIADLILQSTVDDGLIDAVKSAYRDLAGGMDANHPVAVRSSANAEDLPGLSFAGQQETYLNVRGEEAVVAAVKNCWASLWTAQAISYRHQNGIDQDSVAMAVVVQRMVPSEVSGILFTANPASGERSEIIINGSFGLGEAVVSGQVTPDTYIVDRETLSVQQELLGPKEQQIVSDGDNGVRMESVAEEDRGKSSISTDQLLELCETALKIEQLYDGLPQDIEWAFHNGELHLLQSRPITNLPAQPIDLIWEPTPPARFVSRRQIVENMPEPISPLFEDLYLTQGLESPRPKSLMVGGGPMFVTVNGYAYQRFDWPQIIKEADQRKQEQQNRGISEAQIEAAEYSALAEQIQKSKAAATDAAVADLEPFRAHLSDVDRANYEAWYAEHKQDDLDALIVLPESNNPTYIAFNNTTINDNQLKSWYEQTLPRLEGVAEKWRALDVEAADDDTLLAAIIEMGIEEGRYWSADSSHTFGVAKSTDDQLQCFLRETLPEHNFISGQFLTGIESKAMQANADLFKIAKLVRASAHLSYVVLTIPSQFLLQTLRNDTEGADVVAALDNYLTAYGHQGYSMDFIEPTQIEDPSALFATLKGMVRDHNYDPKNQAQKTAEIREKKLAEISNLLSGLSYWQFRFRLWLALKYNFIREEVAFRFGYTWSILRPMVNELGQRLVADGTLQAADNAYFLVSEELQQALIARKAGKARPDLGSLAVERQALREARKLHHPPGTLPAEASDMQSISFKETQIKNDGDSMIMRGFPVSSGSITAKASVILGPAEFDNMIAGSILVSPLTTPAWTQLFANAVGLVTDVGSILAHGSIVAREYGIPAVLGVGDGTKRIKHGQTITVEGDSGVVTIHDDE